MKLCLSCLTYKLSHLYGLVKLIIDVEYNKKQYKDDGTIDNQCELCLFPTSDIYTCYLDSYKEKKEK